MLRLGLLLALLSLSACGGYGESFGACDVYGNCGCDGWYDTCSGQTM